MADRSVRLARADDVPAVVAAQAAAWRSAWSDSLPAEALDVLDSPPAAEAWRSAISAPPSPRHRVLVAEDGSDVVGMAASGPAEDSDLTPMIDVEIVALVVRPDHWRRGHGSRLLTAAVDVARGDGFRHAYAWLPATDEAARSFLTGTGWGPDGVHRQVDAGPQGPPVRQVRLHTDISESE